MEKIQLSDILKNFRKNDTLFKTPEKLLLCKGSQKRFKIEFNDSSKLKEEITALQKQYKGQMIIGAIPFDHSTKATIIVPEKLEYYHESDLIDDLHIDPQSLTIEHSIDKPNRQQFNEMVQNAINFINDKQFNKVVLARTLNFRLEADPQISSWLTNLMHKNKQGYIFQLKRATYKI